jgi:sulfate adenylyltransferase subunit 2
MTELSRLQALEAKSIFIIREAFANIDKMAMLWSFGKDSTVLLWLARKAFFGNIPFPLIHCDTELEMAEVYAYRERYSKEWGVNLHIEICPPIEETDPTLPHDTRVAARKTLGLKNVMQKLALQGIMAGIRRDEEGTRGKERVFSPRAVDSSWDVKEQPPEFWGYYNTHIPKGATMRIHPLLHWSELDIWEYIALENIPIVPLYLAKSYGAFEGRDFGGAMMRFRSLGERGITWPTASEADTIEKIIAELRTTKVSERAGRPMGADSDEASFEKLRRAGYM